MLANKPGHHLPLGYTHRLNVLDPSGTDRGQAVPGTTSFRIEDEFGHA